MNARYPNITVQLTDHDGNGMAILSSVAVALGRGGVSSAEIDKFTSEALGGDYNSLLQTCTRWVVVK